MLMRKTNLPGHRQADRKNTAFLTAVIDLSPGAQDDMLQPPPAYCGGKKLVETIKAITREL